MEAGKECGAANAGYQAIDSLSIEKGSRHWHMDLRLDDDPLEAGLVFACKLKSPVDFRSALQLKRSKGLNKRIACFTIDELSVHSIFVQCRRLQLIGCRNVPL